MVGRRPAAPRHVAHPSRSAAPAASAHSARRAGRAIAAPTMRCVQTSHGSDDGLDRFDRRAARPQQDRVGGRQVEHGRFHAHRTGPAVQHRRDASGQVVQHVLRRGRAHPAGAVRRRRSDWPTGFSQQRERGVVCRDPHRQPCRAPRWPAGSPRSRVAVAAPGSAVLARMPQRALAPAVGDHVGECRVASG